ncbi:RNA polymerase III transcription factor IIIC subunit-domain-containing protein [Dichotomocladium elegans]|nr:RNA polymerase III transcription factor IIIC subunit-domain-containing protein [Dichotomocladium elegans]
MSKVALADAKFLCIEYPGRVKNVDRALETLGGEEALVSALNNSTKAVELRFRPKDPFSHPITSIIKPTSNILLKVTRRRKKNDPEDNGTIETNVVGIVNRICRFRGMSDYQYILSRESRMMKLRQNMEKGNVKEIIAFKSADEDNDSIRPDDLPPPPLFSVREIPFPYEYKQNLHVLKVRMRQPDGTYVVKSIHYSQKNMPNKIYITYDHPTVPTEPSIPLEALPANEQRVAKQVAELFKERPSWTRAAVLSRLAPGDRKYYRAAVQVQTYSFSSGPWRDCLLPFGVDPRTDPAFAKYQYVGARVNQRRPPTSPVQQIKLPQHYLRPKKTTASQAPQDINIPCYIFDGKTLPSSFATLTIDDITDPDFQKLIHTPAYIKSKCTRISGFYYPCVYQRLRSLIKKKWIQILKDGVADPIPNADEGLSEEIANEKNEMPEDENEDDSMDEAESQGLWGETDDPEMANMLKSLRQAGALGMDIEDIEDMEGFDVDALEDDEEGDEDEPLWKFEDLDDL